MRLLLLFIFTGTFCAHKGDSWRLGTQKQWLPDLEFTTRGNWISNKVPTKNSRIKFPLEIQHSVGLPLTGDLFFSGIELSRDGSLLLPLNGRLQLTEPKGTSSKDNNPEIFEWKWKGPFSWVDPENWGGSNQAVPHLEKIPCDRDMVILPSNNRSLSIRLPTVDVNVKEVKIGKSTPLASWDWQEVMRGREFTNSHWSVKYSGLPYCDSDKCLCRHSTDMYDLMKEICEIERPRCLDKEVACSYPMGVEGHCCAYCGGQLFLSVNHATFPLSKLNEITNEALSSYGDISHHVRVTLNGNVQVLVTENGVYTGIKSAEAVETLHSVFSGRGINVLSYAVTGASLKGSALATALGPLFGVPLVIIILILIAVPSFGYSYKEVYFIFRASIRQRNLPPDDPGADGNFGFARFENIATGEVQLTSPIIEDEMGSDDDHEDGKRFENPLYRSKRKGPVEKIIDIDAPVSLAELEGKVASHEDANIDSD
ncbi:protein amnionless-like [Diachasmimorpha longicaudata]|uniref:protein amnionless-like n=1 Tax=Diachasmimorpha longicaudata TaxID=58733 RepID=UPI0030B8B957